MAYTGFHVFGDSLVDAGNALKLAQWYGDLTFSDLPEGAPTAELGYFGGRFSNGYTFADLLANKTIGVVTKPVFPYGYEDPWLGVPVAPFASDPSGNNLNFAYGGAQIRQGDEVVPDLDGQTDAFRNAVDGDPDPTALYLVTMGGNDVRSLAKAGSDPVPVAEAQAALAECAQQMIHELGQLIDRGVHHLLITGVPDVGLIPKYDQDDNLVLDATEQARSDAATAYSLYLDNLIRTQVVPALEAMGADVTYVPIMGPAYTDENGHVIGAALDAVMPTLAALNGLTTSELTNNLLDYQGLLFFDQVHPTAQVHALIGSYLHAELIGAAWVETQPLRGADVDYRLTAGIAAAGEVDRLTVSLVAGTTYTIEMLGMSSLSAAGSLGDAALRLVGPNGSAVGTDADSGAGFDATLTFTAAMTGLYTAELSATGSLTGAYVFQAAVVGGAAMQAGNIYTVNNALTVVIEGAGGAGQDVVRTSVSYALGVGSEIEMLRTTNDKGKGAINLTGNDFAQAIVGNAGANVLDGKGGADTLTGGAGKDVFVLGDASTVDSITDFGSGDLVDVSQLLSVAAGTNVATGGFVRVTTSGLVQIDANGGGDGWVTLSTINSGGAVTVRYLADGALTTATVARVAASSGTAALSAEESLPGVAWSMDHGRGMGAGPSDAGFTGFDHIDSGAMDFTHALLRAEAALMHQEGWGIL